MKQFVFHFDKDGYHITVKLPRSYYQACDSRYPALIVHDGDDLFKKLKSEIIFIGITSPERAHDFTPWAAQVNDQETKGQADQYLDWLVEKLIPDLRAQFRICDKREKLGISGASYGALVALYALYRYPETFGKFLLISPSLWYPHFIEFMEREMPISAAVDIYWYVGLKEGIRHTHRLKEMVPKSLEGQRLLQASLLNQDASLYFETSRRGIHRPRYFKKYFKRGVGQLF
ncbi:alpha/beta hydrolase-fold protein [Staphylococcus pettenkoferi]|uniref:alpha/beta hydrolase n=1 Tax=Staphylococcus pettenkoferi TaxID=170573 RepID=UPI002273B1BF|nr:alpha/beta hydrolase-fold protein [Staphylococcus pettenkoferi]MCY1575987.1 alpha/beta hydrolase-fold protein [Staphylococcus pettenkoferi]MCY1617747.1 alpha/beta hydrolase-fold protein [Staphylococcus pettenkoferi]